MYTCVLVIVLCAIFSKWAATVVFAYMVNNWDMYQDQVGYAKMHRELDTVENWNWFHWILGGWILAPLFLLLLSLMGIITILRKVKKERV